MPKRLAKGKHLLFLKLKPGPVPVVEATSQGKQVFAAPTMEKVRESCGTAIVTLPHDQPTDRSID